MSYPANNPIELYNLACKKPPSYNHNNPDPFMKHKKFDHENMFGCTKCLI